MTPHPLWPSPFAVLRETCIDFSWWPPLYQCRSSVHVSVGPTLSVPSTLTQGSSYLLGEDRVCFLTLAHCISGLGLHLNETRTSTHQAFPAPSLPLHMSSRNQNIFLESKVTGNQESRTLKSKKDRRVGQSEPPGGIWSPLPSPWLRDRR